MKYTSITENHLFSKAYAKGKRFVGKLTAVYVLPDYAARRLMLANPQKKYFNRLGISVSKKVGGAVLRSRVRRIIREGYRAACSCRAMKTGYLIVISGRSAAGAAKSTEVSAELCRAFDFLGLVQKDGSKETQT